MKLSALPFLLLTFLPLTVVVASASTAQSPPAPAQTPASVTLPPELDRVLRDYEKAWIAKDTAAVAALFAPDGYALPSGSPPAHGADAIRAAYAGSVGAPLSLRAFAYAQSGDLAYILGGYAFTSAAGKPDFGKFTLVLTRGKDGRWLVASDMDNANQPSRAPAAAANKP